MSKNFRRQDWYGNDFSINPDNNGNDSLHNASTDNTTESHTSTESAPTNNIITSTITPDNNSSSNNQYNSETNGYSSYTRTPLTDLSDAFITKIKQGLTHLRNNATVNEILNTRDLVDFQKNFQRRYLPSIKAHFGRSIRKSIPEEYKLIILIDIVGFSKGDNEHQVMDIYLFQSYLMKMKFMSNHIMRKSIPITSFIPTGDGCYIIVDKCKPELAVDFLVSLISGYRSIQQSDISRDQLALRVSAHFGTCVPFMDITMHKNYIGTGMNEAARILSYGQSSLESKLIKNGMTPDQARYASRNSLYVGDSLKDAVIAYSNANKKEIAVFSNVTDKHGLKRNITILEDL